MPRLLPRLAAGVFLLLLLAATRPAWRAVPAAENTTRATAQDAARPYGLRERVRWTTSRVRGTPEPPPPYRAERVFPRLSFKNPLVLSNAPGTDQLFVGEQLGKVYSIPPDPQRESADLLVDAAELAARLRDAGRPEIEFEALYGLTFHPQFAENRYCYLCYVVRYKDTARGQLADGTRVVRLTVSRTDPPRCDPASEQVIITWLQGGHNGGCLKFGPDGCLYISSGDGAGPFPADLLNAGQDVTSLLSDILRIDVDHPAPGLNYSIPVDNPFVSLAGARGEIWAYGLRNPWKMSFDRQTGELWVGDVGWELWELVHRVHKGANFGWSLFEGRQPVYTERQRGPTPIVPPTIEIPHTDGCSVTGGFVYRGKKFPELAGQYVFGDWETRRVWGVPVEVGSVGARRDLMEPSVRIVDFAEDNNGELYLLDFDAGTIHTFERSPPPESLHEFPRLLSETGLFTSVADQVSAPGVVPFAVNAPQWADGAVAERWVAIPDDGTVVFHSAPRPIPGSMFSRGQDYPKDSVLVKTLSLERAPGVRSSRRPVETQLLHFDGRDWRGYSYQWNADATDAALVDAEGRLASLSVPDPDATGAERRRTWRFASRTECLRCHNPWAENALGFQTAQLNRDQDYGGIRDNQLRVLEHVGIVSIGGDPPATAPGLSAAPAADPAARPRLADPLDPAAELAVRARAYLHANCGHCHRNGGGGSAYLHLNFELPLAETKALGVRPSQGTFGIHDARLIAPGDPFRSVLYYRMAKLGSGRMPHIGSAEVDEQGLALIHDWIRALPTRPDDQTLLERLVALPQPGEAGDDAASAERQKLLDDLLATPSRAALLARAVRMGQGLAGPSRALAIAAGIRHADPAIRDLFEPFIPEERRVRRLGDVFQPQSILQLAGDAARGKELFHRTAGVQCRNCHRIADDGTEIGPDLTQIGKKHDRARLLENIVEPSRSIEPQYATWLVETIAGRVLTGILVRRDDREIVIRDAQNREHRIPTGEVETATAQQVSLMPDLLVRDLTAQQVADLLSYLEGLK